MIKLLAVLTIFIPLNLSATVWTDIGLTFGSNEFSRTELTAATNISTTVVGGLNVSAYKIEKREYVYSIRMPVNFFASRRFMVTVKPYLYPKNSDGYSAAGGKLSLSLVKDNPQAETSTTWIVSAAHQKQAMGRNAQKITSNSAEIQAEKNFYDQFFILAGLAINASSAHSEDAIKNYAEVSDLFSVNTFAFINDDVYSKVGLQFARSFKPDFDSYFYGGYDRINSRFSDYGSWLMGLRINFSDKSFANFSYNYLDAKKGSNKAYYKFAIGMFF